MLDQFSVGLRVFVADDETIYLKISLIGVSNQQPGLFKGENGRQKEMKQREVGRQCV